MKRLPLPDLLKGFAVFLIIPVHILELFIDNAGQESLFGKILLFLGGPFAVPVFMIVMGYFVAANNKPVSRNLIRGIKIFLLGFLLNVGLNFHLLLKIKYAGWPYIPLEYLFGVDIFYLAGLSVIILSLLKEISNCRAWIGFVLIFIITGLTSFMNEKLMVTDRNYIYPFIAGKWSWSYFPLFPWLAYPLAGFVFYHWQKKIISFLKNQKVVSAIIVLIIAGFVFTFSGWGFNITIHLSKYYHHTFFYSLWAFGVVILWTLLLRILLRQFPNTYFGNFLMWLGKNITLFYIVQWLIIGNIATGIYQTQSIETFGIWFAGILAVTVVLTWLLAKTNFRPAR